MRLYLSCPIDRSSPEQQAATQALVRELLDGYPKGEGMDLVVFNPTGAFQVSFGQDVQQLHQQTARFVITVNEAALQHSDAMLLLYHPGIESWGIPQELVLARQLEIPVFVYCPSGLPERALPLYLSGRIQPELLVASMPELIRKLTDWQG